MLTAAVLLSTMNELFLNPSLFSHPGGFRIAFNMPLARLRTFMPRR